MEAAVIIIICGAFAVCGAVFDWEFFMNNHKTQFFIRLLGRPGARIFYMLLGSGLVILGLLLATGVLK